jgi:EAL domain-containing protein (putative c-di-GMP-specific phosphodiesterase class I)/signal transduction histidine kinase
LTLSTVPDEDHTIEDERPPWAASPDQLENDVREAVAEHQVVVEYQPVVRTDDHAIVGAEAFARLRHPDRGEISPEVFLPVVARLGLTRDFTAEVLNATCAQLVAWKDQGRIQPDAQVSVNLSADDLLDPALVGSVSHALDRVGMDARFLTLEVTEIGMVRDTRTALAHARDIRRLGARLIVDDFGTGYSSLSYLKLFPVSGVKIDKGFADGLGRDAEATALVRGILSLARALGLVAVAEGIENDVQLEALRQIGCRYAQGYYFCRPVTPDNFPTAVDVAPAPGERSLLAEAGLGHEADKEVAHLGLAVLDALPATITVLGEDGTIIATNLAWKRFALENGGNSATGGVGANYLDVCENAKGPGAEDGSAVARGLRAVLTGHRDAFQLEYDCSYGDRARRYLLTASPVAAGSGAVVVAHLDITGRHLAEAALAESEERFRSIFDQAPLGIFRLGTSGAIVDANRAMCELAGRSREELEGLSRAGLFDSPAEATDPDSSASVVDEDSGVGPEAAPGAAAQPGGLRSSRRRLRRPDGSLRDVQVNDVVIHDPEGKPHALVGTVEDITDGLRLAEELRRAQQMEALGQLAAGIAHEINTPVQFISDNLAFLTNVWAPVGAVLVSARAAAARLLAGDPPAEVARELETSCEGADLDFVNAEVPTALAQSQEGVERVATIVRAMKAFGRPDTNDPEPTDLNRLVANAITVARNELKYVAEVSADFGVLTTLMCFPGAISQVVLNLLVNAAYAVGEAREKSGERGRINIKTWAEADYACISVSDSGLGIPPEVLPRIFQPFFTTKPFGRGTGQGLAMAWATVVERHSGRIDVATSSEGTTFTVRVPLKPQRTAAMSATVPEGSQGQ